MVETATRQAVKERTKLSIIDCDIHPFILPDVLRSYLPERWRRYHDMVGMRGHHGYAGSDLLLAYPKNQPGGVRTDAWTPEGTNPGSSLPFMQEQHLDPIGIEYGILNPHHEMFDQLNHQWAAAIARAINDWTVAEWLDQDERLRASMMVAYEDADLAVEEIQRLADDPRFVQVQMVSRTLEPLGHRRYWKMYEAAEHYGLPIGVHFGGIGGNPITSSGWPSYYIEDHTTMSQVYQSQVTSLAFEGVFDCFPNLRFVMIEGGLAWVPPLMWRMDKHYKRMREEVSHLERLPSEYVREHMYFTTQPIEEPPNPKHLLQTIEQFGADDRILFATDYPHWDYDEPERAFPVRLPKDLEQKIFAENARALYGLEKKE
jgi:predicted TIM-barrel fold metal-dependent hydrolase